MTIMNADVKQKAMQRGVRLFQVAQHCNMSESTFNRHMRKELSPEEREKFLTAIDEIAKENAKGLV